MEERKSLLQRSRELPVQYGATPAQDHRRASSLGAFQFLPPTNIAGQLPRSYSVDGTASVLTPSEMGRQELYTQVPFTAVFGLQKRERDVSQAFASYAAELNVDSHPELSEREKRKMTREASHVILDQLEHDTHVVTTPLVFAIIVATASQFLVGYNTGVMNAPEKFVFPGHSTGLWSLAVAAFAVGGPFGAIAGGKLADARGRRGALLMDSWTFLMGGLIQTLAPDMFTIVLSRFLVGFASGFSSVLVPIYLGELAPPTLRGMLGTLTQFALVIGILAADVLAFPFATEEGWRALFAVTPIVTIIQLVCSPFLLESPRWLLNRNPESNQARYIIKQLRGFKYDHQVEHEIGNYIIGEAAQHQDTAKSQYDIVKEMISHPKIRILLMSSLFLQMSNQFSGINAVFYYSTSFFEGVIDNPLVGTTIVGVFNVVATYFAMLLMDSCGRKRLLLWSSGGMFLSCVVIVLSLLGYFNNMTALVAVNVYVIFFEIGLVCIVLCNLNLISWRIKIYSSVYVSNFFGVLQGPIPWLIVPEMFEGKYVATAMSLCCQLNWACNFIIGLVFPSMNEYLGPYSFGPFAVMLAAAFFYALLVLPETQGTKPEDLIAEMVSRNAKNIVYNAMDVPDPAALDAEWHKVMDKISEDEHAKKKEVL